MKLEDGVTGLNFKPNIASPIGPGDVKYLCDYCGGFTVYDKNRWTETVKNLTLTSPKTGMEKVVCIDCWVEVFDKVLRP